MNSNIRTLLFRVSALIKHHNIHRRVHPRIRFAVSAFIGIIQRYPRISTGIGIALLAVLSFVFVFRDVPSPTKLKNMQAYALSTKILDRNGELLYEIYTDENRTPVKLSDLPPYVSQASIAIEDQNFYRHFGFDLTGIIRALKNTVFSQKLQGGSTITQQLVKTALLTRERTLTRKIREALLTVFVEIMYSKNDILEMYLNHIPYGGTSWGVEAASQTYFGKHAKDLSLAEAALLAGLPQSPTRYSPFGTNPDLAKARQREVLRRMVEDKYISAEQEKQAEQELLKYAPPKININAPHFVFYVKDLLEEKYGEALVERGGLRVYTTLDLKLQNDAQASLSAEINKLTRYRVGNGAAMVTKPDTGEILAMIGSRNFFDATHDGQVNVTLRERQPGSSIKPLNVVTGFQLKKITPATMLLDIPTCFFVAGQKQYCPKNYDGGYHGPVQTRFFLGNSYNIPQVKLLAANTLESFIATASAMGITSWKDSSNYGLSLTLGGGEVRMYDMAVAFGTLANEGVRVPLQPILRVEDVKGTILEQFDPEQTKKTLAEMTKDQTLTQLSELRRVLNREPAYLVSHILLDNSARAGAFGTGSKLVIPNQVVSVKTGTTNDLRDNWTIGYTPEYLTAVWVGNNDNTTMNQSLVSGITGAAPIWNSIMSRTLKGKKAVWPEKPQDIVSREICVLSGLLPNPESPCQTRNEFFWKGTEPKDLDPPTRDTWIVPTKGVPPIEGDSLDGLTAERHLLLSDPFTKDYCVDCTRPVDEKGSVQYEQHQVDMQEYYAGYDEQPNRTTPQ
ncbi:MAG TPA: transglycosylase domain-containing protein [Patescibacteria group bacterium]|nr:transglycosylase domain-containing protein [Patescibacteria group bacterium]